MLKIKTKAEGFDDYLLTSLLKQVLQIVRKQKTSAFALVFIYSYSRWELPLPLAPSPKYYEGEAIGIGLSHPNILRLKKPSFYDGFLFLKLKLK